jgi:DNA-binding MarR family transcriptional regulator
MKVKLKRRRLARTASVLSLPTNLLGFNIARLAHLKRTRDDALFKTGVGIGLNQLGLLLLLDAHPGVGGGQLARMLMITPQSIAPLLAGLEELELIERVGTRRRGVRVGVHITAKGRGLLLQARRILRRTEQEARLRLSAQESGRFNDFLIRVAAGYIALDKSHPELRSVRSRAAC